MVYTISSIATFETSWALSCFPLPDRAGLVDGAEKQSLFFVRCFTSLSSYVDLQVATVGYRSGNAFIYSICF